VKQDPKRDQARVPAEVIGLGLNVVAAAFLFGFLGHWVGERVGADEVLTLLGGLIGAGAGYYSLYVHLVGRSRDDQENKSE